MNNNNLPNHVQHFNGMFMNGGGMPINGVQNFGQLNNMNQARLIQQQMAAAMNRSNEPAKCEVYRFTCEDGLFATGISNRKDPTRLRIGLGTLHMTSEKFKHNKVGIIELDEKSNELRARQFADHSYPPTKILFTPDSTSIYDLMCTSSDYLRIYKISDDGKMSLLDKLQSTTNQGYNGPYTSMDWSHHEPTRIGVSSSDSTCIIWELETAQVVNVSKAKVKAHLIAHDKGVNDINFTSRDTFVTASLDGSIRKFDLRDMTNSTILYDDAFKSPLSRVQINKLDDNILAILATNSNKINILDIRMIDRILKTCTHKTSEINSIAWSPTNKNHICSGSGDNQALIWQIHDDMIEGTSLRTYGAAAEINNVQWGSRHPQWISITFGNSIEILRV
uniref:WD_REPEATS_REGION domain-containing protein n=1 Tax=Rhabditophanes sp. KR3021 TaxID=114890 RepID=A0AC35TWB7_9BILA